MSDHVVLRVKDRRGRPHIVCVFRKLDLATLHPATAARLTPSGYADGCWHVFTESLRVRTSEAEDPTMDEYYKYSREAAAIRGLPAVVESADRFTFIDAKGKHLFAVPREKLTRALDGLATTGLPVELDTLRRAIDLV